MPQIKGFGNYQKHMPDYPGKKIGIIMIKGPLGMLFGLVILFFFNTITFFTPSNSILRIFEPALPIIGVLIVETIGFLTLTQVWKRKDVYLTESKSTALQRLAPYHFIGSGVVISVLVHILIPIHQLLPHLHQNGQTTFLSKSLLSYLPFLSGYEFVLRIFLCLMVLIIGIFLGQRTLITFGFDYMGLVYLIYPEESEVQKSEIYSITRNPSYLSILIMILAGTILQFSIYSILFFILMYVGFQIWIRTVEEKELIERFGEGYKSYISETPRLFPRPKSLGKFLKYLFIVKEKEKNNKKRV